jgi:hypothetical protein
LKVSEHVYDHSSVFGFVSLCLMVRFPLFFILSDMLLLCEHM